MYKILIVFLILFSCSSSDDNNVNMDNQSYFYGRWKVTAMNRETGENLLILCSNGELSSYTFTSNNELNTLLYIGSASNTSPCQSEIVFYNYEYNPSAKTLIYTESTGNSPKYTSEIIEMSENRFKTRYISGNIEIQTTVPNFTTVYERE